MRPNEQPLLVRYWAGARAAADTAEEYVALPGEATVADVMATLSASHPRLVPVLEVASLLLDGQAAHPEQPIGAANTLEVLPPFAGG